MGKYPLTESLLHLVSAVTQVCFVMTLSLSNDDNGQLILQVSP
jgi:hypothetical protein